MSGSAELPAPDFPPTAEPCGRVWGQPRWVASLLVHCGGLRRRSGLHLSPHPPPPRALPRLSHCWPGCAFSSMTRAVARVGSPQHPSQRRWKWRGFWSVLPGASSRFWGSTLSSACRTSIFSRHPVLGTAGPGTEREDSSLTETTASSRS